MSDYEDGPRRGAGAGAGAGRARAARSDDDDDDDGAGGGAGGGAYDEEQLSQRSLNQSCLEDDSCAVETAAILPFLSAPPRPVLLRPFKLPEGAQASDPAVRARMQLGGRRRVKMLPGGSFKRHDPSLTAAALLGPTPEELAAISEAAALEEAQRLAALAEAETAAAAARIARSLPLKLPAGYEPLVLYQARKAAPRPAAAAAAAAGEGDAGGAEGAGADAPTDPEAAAAAAAAAAASAAASEERDVVVEDVMGVHLRQHQREGVAFVFSCVHGLRGEGING
jgi:hypothetical protein